MSLNDAQQIFGLFFAIYFFLIIDRSHEMYRPWDTYSAWRGRSHNVNRLLTAWLILIILPVTQFGILYTLLGIYNVTFDASVAGVLTIILISIGSFFSFGYFRIYEAFIHRYPDRFFSLDEQKSNIVEIRPHFWAHFIPGLLYVSLSTVLLIISLYI
jgi:hypothetical protein